MRNSCPISFELLDEQVVRLVAFQVVSLTAIAVWSGTPWLPFVLAVDFGLRSLGKGALSPLARLAALVSRLAGLAEKPVNAGPKRFAAKIGALMSLVITLAFATGWHATAATFGGILIICALLESFFGYCVGCQFYHLWMQLRYAVQ
ncbi:MAG: DUF4395 domain-containing protein [Geobacter sp.]|nr:DUF4395 domain-containing protein [Geobacter sp.]